MILRTLTHLALLGLLAGSASADDWLRFRGPNGTGIAPEGATAPTEWSADKNLKWKLELPGPGSSCPIVVGDRVFLTCWSGYGVDRGSPGNQQDLRRHLVCIDRKEGKLLWSKGVKAVLPEDRYSGMFAEHGYATHTPVSDGENVYVFFGKSGVLAFDFDGNQLWQTSVGTGLDRRNWGSSSSPILFKDKVIVPAMAESQSLVALDKKTGSQVWKSEAGGFASTWGTPILVEVNGEPEIVIGVPYEFWAFDPETGKLKWFCEIMNTDSYCSSVVAADGILYGVEGRSGGGIAVKAGGSGDVTKSNVVWSNRSRNRIATPVVHDGHLYYFSGGQAVCLDAKNGEEVYRERLSGATAAGGGRPGGGGGGRGGGQDYSSPILVDGKLYYVARNGTTYVVEASPKFKQLAANRLTNDREDFSATPAVSKGELFIRSSKHLYCIAEEKE